MYPFAHPEHVEGWEESTYILFCFPPFVHLIITAFGTPKGFAKGQGKKKPNLCCMCLPDVETKHSYSC